MRTNVYIDGFNLYYGSLRGSSHKWLDLGAFCDKLLPHNDVQRIRYFTARIIPKPDDPQAPTRQGAYLRAIATIPRVSIHYGHFLQNPTRMPLANPPRPWPEDRRGHQDGGERFGRQPGDLHARRCLRP